MVAVGIEDELALETSQAYFGILPTPLSTSIFREFAEDSKGIYPILM
jgi:hypothetical protein